MSLFNCIDRLSHGFTMTFFVFSILRYCIKGVFLWYLLAIIVRQ